ncbi:MAG: helix-turn-helix transcriptional regulator [Bacillaceae bacterium]|nr:helix-turn-helix transcriptional regulator [Bacillaceae bacterium]
MKGYSVGEIAKSIHISENTVKTHMKKIYHKLNVNNKIDLILQYGNFHIDKSLFDEKEKL